MTDLSSPAVSGFWQLSSAHRSKQPPLRPTAPLSAFDVLKKIDERSDFGGTQARHMTSVVQIEIEMSEDLAQCRLPEGVQERLTTLLGSPGIVAISGQFAFSDTDRAYAPPLCVPCLE